MTTDPSHEVRDPVAYFVEDLEYHGRSERTRNAYERVLRRFEGFLDENNDTHDRRFDVGRRECMRWIHSLRSDHSQSTVATYATYLDRFYGYMTRVGVFDSNPMALVIEEMDEAIETDPQRRDLSIPAMTEFVATICHPLDRAVIVTLLKTGLRVGELCNLDVRDLSLGEYDIETTHSVSKRDRTTDRRDSLFVDSDIARGEVVNGERRTASNKRKRTTVIPVDDELRTVLFEWFAIRPDAASSAESLFLSTGTHWGQRLTTPMVSRIVKNHARAAGWYRTGGDATENVTPHYFRHFFTTHLRDRTGDRGVVKYLRGDVADDIIDTYTHDWGDRVRERYLENIYTFW